MALPSPNSAKYYGSRIGCPFTLSTQLNDELRNHERHPSPSLPGYPRIKLDNPPEVTSFLHRQLISSDLEKIAPKLWWMSKQDSASISPLHRQLVKKRKIVVTEDPKLHLTWLYDRVFIKPLPAYLLSYDFWIMHLAAEPKSNTQQQLLRRAALGYLRTYFFLIQHPSDFRIAQQEDLGLVPKVIEWNAFCDFSTSFNKIHDSEVTERYHYGEIRLTRLNFYAKILLHRWHFHRVEPQYAQYFARFYGPILFAFGAFSVLLSAMQVEIAVEQLGPGQIWPSFKAASRGFSVMTLVALLCLILTLICLLLLKVTKEWMYALRDRFWYKRDTTQATKNFAAKRPDHGHV